MYTEITLPNKLCVINIGFPMCILLSLHKPSKRHAFLPVAGANATDWISASSERYRKWYERHAAVVQKKVGEKHRERDGSIGGTAQEQLLEGRG